MSNRPWAARNQAAHVAIAKTPQRPVRLCLRLVFKGDWTYRIACKMFFFFLKNKHWQQVYEGRDENEQWTFSCKRVTTWCILPIGHSVLLASIQTCYLKNLKLFSIRVKELFEPTVLQKKARGFCSFLKVFSWEIDLWVTLGDFTVKMQNWEGKSVFNWKMIKLKQNMLCCR